MCCASALVQGGSSTANLHEPHHHSAQGVKGTSSGLLKHLEPQRTYRKHTTTEKALCVGCFRCVNHPEHKHRASNVCRARAGWWCGSCRFEEVFCARVGTVRFAVLEPPRTSA